MNVETVNCSPAYRSFETGTNGDDAAPYCVTRSILARASDHHLDHQGDVCGESVGHFLQPATRLAPRFSTESSSCASGSVGVGEP
jgi:hypothetical protein